MAEENAHDFKSLAEAGEFGDSISTPPTTTPKWQWAILIILILATIFLLIWYFFIKPKSGQPATVTTNDQVLSENMPTENNVDIVIPDIGLEIIDTDQDGLSDEDEVLVWLSDPNNSDSDGDTYLDGQEVNSGYSPISTSTLDLSLYILATPQRTLDSLAKAINENNIDLWLQVLALANVEREIISQAGTENLNFMHIYYQNKAVSFVIKSKENLTETKIKCTVDTLLENTFFESKEMIMVQENKQWKILE